MADGDELPDYDYESIYGAEALAARRRAEMDALFASQARILANMNALLDRIADRESPAP